MEAINKMNDPYAEYLRSIRSVWGDGSDPSLPIKVKGLMEKLLSSAGPDGHWWLEEMIRKREVAKELYRDSDYGFIQMGHVDQKGHHIRPHDHGPCWVVYGCIRGVTDITLYRRMRDEGGNESGAMLEKKALHHLTPGVAYSYLPGEIHSTTATESPTVVFRFLSADLQKVKRNRFNLEKGTVTFGY
jgi:hypothetical protein